jgi:hypothetical protein
VTQIHSYKVSFEGFRIRKYNFMRSAKDRADLKALPHLHPWQRNKTSVRDLSCTRCLQQWPVVIQVASHISKKNESSKVVSKNINNILQHQTNPNSNLGIHAETKLAAQVSPQNHKAGTSQLFLFCQLQARYSGGLVIASSLSVCCMNNSELRSVSKF